MASLLCDTDSSFLGFIEERVRTFSIPVSFPTRTFLAEPFAGILPVSPSNERYLVIVSGPAFGFDGFTFSLGRFDAAPFGDIAESARNTNCSIVGLFTFILFFDKSLCVVVPTV